MLPRVRAAEVRRETARGRLVNGQHLITPLDAP